MLNAPARRKLTSASRLGEYLCLLLDDIGAGYLVAHEDDLFTRASAEDAMEDRHMLSTILGFSVHFLELHSQDSLTALSQFVSGVVRDNLPEAIWDPAPDLACTLKLPMPGGSVQYLQLYGLRHVNLVMAQSAKQLGNAVGGKELENRSGVKDVHYSAPPISADSSSEVSRSPVSLGRVADTAGAPTGMIPSSARAAFVAEALESPLSLAIVEEATLPWR